MREETSIPASRGRRCRGRLLAHFALLVLVAALCVGNLWLCVREQAGRRQAGAVAAEPRYFVVMKQGADLEKAGRYRQAIAVYASALSDMRGVDPTLLTQARIAVHNRIGACRRSSGDRDGAVEAFRKSVALGDRKYAPKALRGLGADPP